MIAEKRVSLPQYIILPSLFYKYIHHISIKPSNSSSNSFSIKFAIPSKPNTRPYTIIDNIDRIMTDNIINWTVDINRKALNNTMPTTTCWTVRILSLSVSYYHSRNMFIRHKIMATIIINANGNVNSNTPVSIDIISATTSDVTGSLILFFAIV